MATEEKAKTQPEQGPLAREIDVCNKQQMKNIIRGKYREYRIKRRW
jgi:hypothetical protein